MQINDTRLDSGGGIKFSDTIKVIFKPILEYNNHAVVDILIRYAMYHNMEES